MKKGIKMTLLIIGTIVVLLVLIATVGISSFHRDVKKEKEILFDSDKNFREKILEKDLDVLPDLMKNYLIEVGVLGKSKYSNVIFRQEGKIRTDLDAPWLSFRATQYMSSANPGFIWKARAFPVFIRDKYMDDKGAMRVSFLGLKNVAQFSGSEVDQSSLGRYLGELTWFPIGFLDPDISWETMGPKSVKATITKENLSLEGIFFFDQNGLIDHFETKRYRETELEDFIGEVGTYKDYNGLLVPDSMTAIWSLNEGKFEYFKAAILDYKIKNVIH